MPTGINDAGRIFVSEQNGRLIEIIGNPDSPNGTIRVVLDISNKVGRRGNEEGFLGFAFHPEVASNGRIYVYYSAENPRRSVISEFKFGADGAIDPTSERNLLQVAQPFSNHNGGMLAFGPDGFLYVSLGDGGSGGDPQGNGQNLSTLLGSILRIDVNATGFPYTLPADNPFIGQNAANGQPARGEIWAYGLRNPWRISFDIEAGELWAADVGQNEIEEVDLIMRGGNYGWNIKEGNACYKPSSGCDAIAPDDLIAPITTYGHSPGCSVSGGYVYRGTRLPSLDGAYIYGDFCSGIISALRRGVDGTEGSVVISFSGHLIPAFGQTLDGEVYVLTYSPGIFRFVEK